MLCLKTVHDLVELYNNVLESLADLAESENLAMCEYCLYIFDFACIFFDFACIFIEFTSKDTFRIHTDYQSISYSKYDQKESKHDITRRINTVKTLFQTTNTVINISHFIYVIHPAEVGSSSFRLHSPDPDPRLPSPEEIDPTASAVQQVYAYVQLVAGSCKQNKALLFNR